MSPVTVMYVSQAIHGLAYGMLLFLVASGLTMIFGMMGILNLAHASFFMLSGYFCYTIITVTGNFWMALLIAPVAAGLCGLLVERPLFAVQEFLRDGRGVFRYSPRSREVSQFRDPVAGGALERGC